MLARSGIQLDLLAHRIAFDTPLARFLTETTEDGTPLQPHWNTPQRTDEWHEARRHRLTGSRIGTAFGCFAGGDFDKSSRQLDLLFKQMSGTTAPGEGEPPSGSFEQRRMDYGVENEPQAETAFKHLYRQKHEKPSLVRNIGMLLRPDMPWVGGSVDGIDQNMEYITEYKCRMGSAHTKPSDYHIMQCQWNMMVVNRETVDRCYWLSWSRRNVNWQPLLRYDSEEPKFIDMAREFYTQYIDWCEERDIQIPADMLRCFNR